MEEWVFDRIRRMREEVEKMIREVEREIFAPLFNLEERCLEPLYEVEETGDEVVVRVDLPCVRKREDIRVVATEDRLLIEARMERMVSFEGLPMYGGARFEMFKKEIPLPSPVDPEGARARFRGGILEIRLPKKHKAFRVRVE